MRRLGESLIDEVGAGTVSGEESNDSSSQKVTNAIALIFEFTLNQYERSLQN